MISGLIDEATSRVMEQQGWSEQTMLVLALRFINDHELQDEWFASLLEAAMEENPDAMEEEKIDEDED